MLAHRQGRFKAWDVLTTNLNPKPAFKNERALRHESNAASGGSSGGGSSCRCQKRHRTVYSRTGAEHWRNRTTYGYARTEKKQHRKQTVCIVTSATASCADFKGTASNKGITASFSSSWSKPSEAANCRKSKFNYSQNHAGNFSRVFAPGPVNRDTLLRNINTTQEFPVSPCKFRCTVHLKLIPKSARHEVIQASRHIVHRVIKARLCSLGCLNWWVWGHIWFSSSLVFFSRNTYFQGIIFFHLKITQYHRDFGNIQMCRTYFLREKKQVVQARHRVCSHHKNFPLIT